MIEDENKELIKNDEPEETSEEEEEEPMENKQYFNMFAALTKHKWVYRLPDDQMIELDDTESVLLNQQMNIINIQLFKQKMMWQKLRIQINNSLLSVDLLESAYDTTVESQFILQRYRFQKPNPLYSIDILTKEMTYFWPKKKKDIIV